MGKETRDLLKKILSTQEAIMAHLKIGDKPKPAASPAKKAAPKKSRSNK